MTDIPFQIVFFHIGFFFIYFFFFANRYRLFPLSDFQVNHPSSTWKGFVYLLSRCSGVIAFEAVEPSLRDTQDSQMMYSATDFFQIQIQIIP